MIVLGSVREPILRPLLTYIAKKCPAIEPGHFFIRYYTNTYVFSRGILPSFPVNTNTITNDEVLLDEGNLFYK